MKPNTQIYQSLAAIYDEVMSDIDYDEWADFIDEVIQVHHDDAQDLLELACGTGSFALSLDELDCYNITATDMSEAMLEQAKAKAQFKDSAVKWMQQDFTKLTLPHTYDVVLMLYDSINYLLEPELAVKTLKGIRSLLKPDGYFIFDFTTPINSIRGEESLNFEGITSNNYRFHRTSRYLPEEGMHYNEFEIEQLDDTRKTVLSRFREVHKQRVYTLQEMKDIVSQTDFDWVAAYEGFDLLDANEHSDRITVVLA